jgi:hypothetical protein
VKIRHVHILSRSRLGFRGIFLLGLACLDLFYGLSFIAPDAATRETAAFEWRDRIMPTQAWGAIWIGAGLILVLNAFLRQDRFGYGLAIAIKLGWAFLCGVSWLTGDVHNGWVAMVIWGVFGWVTISESLRGEPLHVHEVTFIDDDPEGSHG